MVKAIALILTGYGIDFSVTNEQIETEKFIFRYILLGQKHPNITTSKQVIYIHEDVWHRRKEQVENRIISLLGQNKSIFARKTNIKNLEMKEADDFLSQNHLMDNTNAHYRYGVAIDQNLVAVATFGRIRIFDKLSNYRSAELIRFANLNKHTVVGGLDKLLQHFIKQHQPNDIITFVDKEWSNGKSLLKLGFKIVEDTPPFTFAVNRHNFSRRLWDKQQLQEDEILVNNLGNIKLKLSL